MTRHEAAVVSAYTGFLCGDFSDMHEYAEKLFKRPVYTHEFGNSVTAEKLRELAKPDFVALSEHISDNPGEEESGE